MRGPEWEHSMAKVQCGRVPWNYPSDSTRRKGLHSTVDSEPQRRRAWRPQFESQSCFHFPGDLGQVPAARPAAFPTAMPSSSGISSSPTLFQPHRLPFGSLRPPHLPWVVVVAAPSGSNPLSSDFRVTSFFSWFRSHLQ